MSRNESTTATRLPGVEQQTQAFLDVLNGSGGQPLETLPPADARNVLVGAQQSVDLTLPAAEVSEKTIEVDGQPLKLIVVRPAGSQGTTLSAFMFFHGGGWVLGDYPTHERLIRDLVAASGAVAVYVDYLRSPEVRFPVAINQAYGATQWVARHGQEIGVDGSRLAVAGNSAGGNLATGVALMAQAKGGPKLAFQLLLWPVTDANLETGSYLQFAERHFLTRDMMRWFWDSYIPEAGDRRQAYASPLQASLEQLAGLPPTLIQTAEFDVLRDEGEAYARKLNDAGVTVTAVRYNGMIHDYGLLNPLSHIPAVREAMQQAGAALKRHLQ